MPRDNSWQLTAEAPAEPSDRVLVARARSGEREAFSTLYRRHSRTVYRFAYSLSGSAAMADDVVQDVFVELMRHLHRYDDARSPLAAYLLGMARNLVRQRQRRLFRREVLVAELPDRAADQDMIEDLERADGVRTVRRALLGLPIKYREAIALCDLQGLDYAAAAVALGVPVGTVRSRLHRGRQILAERLARISAPPSAWRWSWRSVV